jgi:solute carrier family 25 carnitine/acylcarnitine transporter 20/29
VSSPLAGMAFYNAVQFFSYGQAVEMLQSGPHKPDDRLTIAQYFQAGLITGFAVSFVEAPMDLFKSQLQTAIFKQKQNPSAPPQYKGVFDCAGKIFQTGGVRGLFQGLGATIVRDIPAVALYFGTYEMAREAFAKQSKKSVKDLEAWQLLSAGGIGGFFYWISTYPIDVIKSSMQADSIVRSERKYSTMVDCAQKLYAEGGFRSFFKGLSPCLLRSVPVSLPSFDRDFLIIVIAQANAACFFAYEKTRRMLD